MSTRGDLVLAVDLGTGGPKAALVTLDGDIVAHAFEPTKLLLLPDGGAEQDPEGWWTAITAAVRRVLTDHGEAGGAADRLAAVSVTSQWSGTVPVDERGHHLGNAIIWMDSRGAKYMPELLGGPVRVQGYDPRKLRRFIHLTGGAPSHSGKDPIGHLLYLRNEQPELYRRAATFLEPGDHLNARICGRVVSSYDCIVAHWLTDNRDLTRVGYDDGLLALAGLDRRQLPELVPSATVIGGVLAEVADEWGIPTGIPVVTATGDVHSAVLGSGDLGDYEGHLYLGTSSWLSCHLPRKRTDIMHNQAALPSALPGRYFLANEHEVAGGALLWLRDQAGLAADFDEMDALLAASAPGSNGTLFGPWLNGERTPVDDHTIRASWTNVSLTTTRADLVRSVYEGVAGNSRWLLEVVEKFTKRRMPKLNVIGGGALSDAWCQIHADLLDRPIHRVADPQHANTRGAAIIASIALGHADAEALAKRIRIEREFQPDPTNRAVYDELYGELLALYKATRKMHARMNRHG